MRFAPYVQEVRTYMKPPVSIFVSRVNVRPFMKNVVHDFDVWSYDFTILHLEIIDSIGRVLRLVWLFFSLQTMLICCFRL